MHQRLRWIRSVAAFAFCVSASLGIATSATVQTRLNTAGPNLQDLRKAAAQQAGVQPLPFHSAASAARRSRTADKYVTAKSSANPASGTILFPGFLHSEASAVMTQNDNALVVSTLAVDVNKDGLPDVVTVQSDGTLSVALNPGKGNLGSIKLSSVNTGAQEYTYGEVAYAVAADLSGNGYPDILAVDVGNNSIYTFKNQQDGTFAFPTETTANFATAQMMSLADGGGGGAFAVGDVTGDGIPDLVVMMMTPPIEAPFGNPGPNTTMIELLTFPGKGDGTFAAPLPEQSYTVPLLQQLNICQIALADMDHDGHNDLVYVTGFSDTENFVTVLHGNNNGTFGAPPTVAPTSGAIEPGADATPGGFSIQDVNGDGNLDVLYSTYALPASPFETSSQSYVYVAYGNGDGTFQPAVTAISTLGYPQSMNFADVTGDGI